MWRHYTIDQIKSADEPFDVLVIGGGATGLGIAVDAASRGYSVVILERDDFAKGTSSRSTKLAHGGVRYLAQGNIRLVLEALRERGIMKSNAPALVRDLPFVVPAYHWWEIPFYFIGLKLYDVLAGKRSIGESTYLSRRRVMECLPGIKKKGLKGGIVYYDGQFDDSRMAVSLAKTAEEQGAVVLNYAEVSQIDKDEESDLFHIGFKDQISDQEVKFSARTVFNATGVFVDDILDLEKERSRRLIAPSRGAHLVVDSGFLESAHGLMIPRTADGRILFAIPWYDKTLIGTTDTPVDRTKEEPQPSAKEIDFILETAANYMIPAPTRNDIRSVFAGLRPLAAPEDLGKKTKEISRGHRVLVSPHQMITIIGGKWTTYRKMAEDAIDQSISLGRLPRKKCRTASLPLWVSDLDRKYGLGKNRGEEEVRIEDQARTQVKVGGEVSPRDHDDEKLVVKGYPWTVGDVRYMIREEYAMTIEDILSRRMRLLILDARVAILSAHRVGDILTEELPAGSYDPVADEEAFRKVSIHYLPSYLKNEQ